MGPSRDPIAASLLVLGGLLLAARPAAADEGGVSFWLPGQLGSFAAVPGDPGWSIGTVYYHAPTGAGAAREFSRGARIITGLNATADLLFLKAGTHG
jgi:hypothetical protein